MKAADSTSNGQTAYEAYDFTCPDGYAQEGTSCKVVCAENEHVSNGACTACPAGKVRPAGDDPSGDDTTCNTFMYTKIFDGYHTNYKGGKSQISTGNIDSPAACAQYCHDHSATDIVGFLYLASHDTCYCTRVKAADSTSNGDSQYEAYDFTCLMGTHKRGKLCKAEGGSAGCSSFEM